MLPSGAIAFSNLRSTLGPNDLASVSLSQYKPSASGHYSLGISGVTESNLALSAFRGKQKVMTTGWKYHTFAVASTYTFSAGAAGMAGALTAAAQRGGGGAGGVVVMQNGNPITPTSVAVTPGSGITTNIPNSGGGGIGFGAGGGGSGSRPSGASFVSYPATASGANGFAYLNVNGYEYFSQSASDSWTCPVSGQLYLLLMGGGGMGARAYFNPGVTGSGGGAGYLLSQQVTVSAGTVITITVPSLPTSYSPGSATTVTINGTPYIASPGTDAIPSNVTGVASTPGIGSSYGGTPYGISPVYGYSGGSQSTADANAFTAAITGQQIISYFADFPNWFSSITPNQTGIITDMSSIAAATANVYTANTSQGTFSATWVGYFYAPTTGTYTFTITSDDAAYLWVGSAATTGYTTANATINNGGSHGMVAVSGTASLTAGTLTPLRIQYGNGGGGYDFTMSFSGPGIGTTTNFSGYIYQSNGSNASYSILSSSG